MTQTTVPTRIPSRLYSVENTEGSGDPSELGGDEDLMAALRRLNEDERRILTLRYYAELKLEEIADLMDAPLGTIKSKLHRTLTTLRAMLSEAYAGDR